MNGPFVHARPGQPPGILPAVDVSRPLTGTIDSNRGGFTILAPPTCPPDALGVQAGEFRQCAVDLRPDQRTAGERLAVTLGLELDPGIDKNNDPRGRRTHGRACELHDFVQDGFFWPHVRALVEWGNGAAHFSALVDFHHGAVLSVPANTLRVSAQYRVATRPWDEFPPEEPPRLPTWRAMALAGYGGHGQAATLTEIAQLENPGDLIDVPIPSFATSFTVLPVSDAVVTVQQIGLGLGFPVRWTVATPLSNAGQYNALSQIQRFNGAEFVRVTNGNGQGPAYAFLVFGLAL